MRYLVHCLGLFILLLSLVSAGYPEDLSLPYFLGKISPEEKELSRKEKAELLSRMNDVFRQAQQIQRSLIDAIQVGEMKLEYQEGRFWMSKLEEDRETIKTGIQQLKLLTENPNHLTASIRLYKSLRDLSSHFNAYNNIPSFSAFVGDLAPEMALWADPIFYQLYLLPLAYSKDKERESVGKNKKPAPKSKKP
jgi:hypothetical protein